MKLHAYFRSSASWRVRIALAWKGIVYETVPVHLLREGGEQHSPAYRAIHPLGRVPTLEFEAGGRTVYLHESLAIVEYLEERFPDPPLLPRDPLARARVRELAEIVNSAIQPFQNSNVLKRLKHALHADEKAWARHYNEVGLGALESLVSASAGRYAVGDAVSLADVCLVPQLSSSRRFGVDLAPFPTLTRVEAACAALPAFQAAQPDRQPDAEP